MTLKIYYSDRIDDLAKHLEEQLRIERKQSDLFAFSQIVVPNTNVAKWLRIRAFADAPELCMGVEFPFFEQCLAKLMRSALSANGKSAAPELLPMNAYANGIAAILIKDDDDRLAPFRKYVSGSFAGKLDIASRKEARMLWQLSAKLADLMDQYEVRRPEIVANWLNWSAGDANAKEPSSEIEKAEAVLAAKLFGTGGLYPPDGNKLSLRQMFDRVEDEGVSAPEGGALFFFGQSTLTILQVKLLHWLARTRKVIFYHNNVCLEYWGDVENERVDTKIKRLRDGQRESEFTADGWKDLPIEDDSGIENPLLQQWGIAGRETLRLIVDFEEENSGSDHPVDFCWEEIEAPERDENTVLATVQSSIRHRTRDLPLRSQDASIQIVGAPGIRREVEMVYNAILGAVWQPENSGERPWNNGKACSFSDIAVLVPDMATYRPVIESVFDARGQIPYGLIDSSAAEDSQYLAGFMAIADLARKGLSRETLFNVLENQCIQAAFGFNRMDLAEWRAYTKDIGAFDGYIGREGHENVSWEKALKRLRLGLIAEPSAGLDVCQVSDDGNALRFSEIVELLYRETCHLTELSLPCYLESNDKNSKAEDDSWSKLFGRLLDTFLKAPHDSQFEQNVRLQIIQAIYGLRHIGTLQQFDFVVEAVAEFVGDVKCQKGGYLTYGVTVAGLKPMRPVPFRQVFVLGMGEGKFPGRADTSTLDIRGLRKTLGDTSVPEQNRYLFLETLMAVKDRLVVSYPNLEITKDAELFPSGMVCELEKFISTAILKDTEFREVKLSLLERGEGENWLNENPVGEIQWKDSYFAGLLPTYYDKERELAGKIASVLQKEPDEVSLESTGENLGEDDGVERISVTAKELAEFIKSPLRGIMRFRLGIAVEGDRDDSIEDVAPLELPSTGPVRWEYEKQFLSTVAGNPVDTDVVESYKTLDGSGRSPAAANLLGQYSIDKFRSVTIGDHPERLGSLKNFVDTFIPAKEDGKIADMPPVRTIVDRPSEVLPAWKGPQVSVLFTGQTQDWVKTADDSICTALVYGPSGDSYNKKGEVAETLYPPDAVIEPLVTWLMFVSGMDETSGDARFALRIGIADLSAMIHNVWEWGLTRDDARGMLMRLTEHYLGFVNEVDKDRRYVDFGYRKLREALKKSKITQMPDLIDFDWRNVIANMTEDYKSDKGDYDKSLVIEETLSEYAHLPLRNDAECVARMYKTMFYPVMFGMRVRAAGAPSANDKAKGGVH